MPEPSDFVSRAPIGRRLALKAEVAIREAPAPRLDPGLAGLYRQKVAGLVSALGQARELVHRTVRIFVTLGGPGFPRRPWAKILYYRV